MQIFILKVTMKSGDIFTLTEIVYTTKSEAMKVAYDLKRINPQIKEVEILQPILS